MLSYVEQNILFVEEYLKQHIPQIKALRPEASFLVWLDCRGLKLNPKELINLFVNKARLALNDGSMFFPPRSEEARNGGFMRLNVGTPRRILEEALQRLAGAIQKS